VRISRSLSKNRETDEVKLIPFYIQGAIGPAGEINSCAADFGRYLLFQMNSGKLEGKQLLSENNVIQMQIPQMVIQQAPTFPETGTSSYGMGLVISTYRGPKMPIGTWLYCPFRILDNPENPRRRESPYRRRQRGSSI
jgi:CubicO group peptidase (beta-lactamase class C family)